MTPHFYKLIPHSIRQKRGVCCVIISRFFEKWENSSVYQDAYARCRDVIARLCADRGARRRTLRSARASRNTGRRTRRGHIRTFGSNSRGRSPGVSRSLCSGSSRRARGMGCEREDTSPRLRRRSRRSRDRDTSERRRLIDRKREILTALRMAEFAKLLRGNLRPLGLSSLRRRSLRSHRQPPILSGFNGVKIAKIKIIEKVLWQNMVISLFLFILIRAFFSSGKNRAKRAAHTSKNG